MEEVATVTATAINAIFISQRDDRRHLSSQAAAACLLPAAPGCDTLDNATEPRLKWEMTRTASRKGEKGRWEEGEGDG